MPPGVSRVMRILAAGNQDDVCRLLVSRLRVEKYEIIEVDQSGDASVWFRTGLVDAAILADSRFIGALMDHLPKPHLPSAPPLVVCGPEGQVPLSTSDSWPEGLVFLPKPFTESELLAALRKVQPAFAVKKDLPGKDLSEEGRPQRQYQRLEFFGRLAAGVVHDFNNLLTVILGAGEFLSLKIPADDPQRVFVEQIQQAAQKGVSLIHQLKALSKNQLPRPCSLDLNRTLATVRNHLRNLLGGKIALDMHPSETLGLIEADPGQIEQVIMNLALNARDAMPEGGTFRLTTADLVLTEPLTFADTVPAGSYVLLIVTDTGTGMDENTMQHLFEPFFSTKEPGRGAGLGLVSVHGILKSCHAHVAVTSQVNHGTTFTLFFPRASAPVTAV